MIWFVLCVLQTAPKIFGGDIKAHLLAFFGGDDDKYSDIMASLKKVAAQFKGKVRHEGQS